MQPLVSFFATQQKGQLMDISIWLGFHGPIMCQNAKKRIKERLMGLHPSFRLSILFIHICKSWTSSMLCTSVTFLPISIDHSKRPLSVEMLILFRNNTHSVKKKSFFSTQKCLLYRFHSNTVVFYQSIRECAYNCYWYHQTYLFYVNSKSTLWNDA